MNVRLRNFSRTVLVTDPAAVDNLVGEVTAEVDAFIASLSLNNVMDVRTRLNGSGKYGQFLTYEALVFYLE